MTGAGPRQAFRSGLVRERRLGRVAALAGSAVVLSLSLAPGAMAQPAPALPAQEAPDATGRADARAAENGASQSGPLAADGQVSSVLSTLLTSRESQQLAADIEALITLGDMEQARILLAESIEAGTLAALIVDSLQSPELLAALKSVSKPPARVSASAQPVANMDAEPRLRELQQALQRETQRADYANQELADLKNELASELGESEQLAARLRDVSGEIDRHKGRADAAERDNEALRQQLEGLRAADAKLAELGTALATEKARAETASSALAAKTATMAAAETKLAELQDALGRARKERREADGALDGLRQQLAALQADRQRADDLQAALTQERAHAATIAQERDELKKRAAGLREAESKLASLTAALERERERADTEAAAVQSGRSALLADAYKITELEYLLNREKQRANDLDAKLAARQTAGQASANVAGPWMTAGTPSPFDLLQPRLPKAVNEDVASTAALVPLATRAANVPTTPSVAQVSPAAEPASAKRLVDRAEALMQSRDIVGARLLLDRAVQEGSGRAMLMLAQTYDPKMLERWKVVGGVVGDEKRAQELYGMARAKGFESLGMR